MCIRDRLTSPNGLTAEKAIERMEAEGFSCEKIENGTFSTTFMEKHQIKGKDFIRCKRALERGVDDVALVVENELVTDILIDFDWNSKTSTVVDEGMAP